VDTCGVCQRVPNGGSVRILPERPVTQRDDVDRHNPEAGLHTGPVRLVCWKPPWVAGRGSCRYSIRLRLGSARPARSRTRQWTGLTHLRSCISARAPTSVSKSARSSSFAGTDDHAARASRPEPARPCSTSPETMSHRPGRDAPRSVRAGPDSWLETWWQAGGPGNIVSLTCWIPASKVRHEESDRDGPQLCAKPAASSAVAPVRAGAAEPSGEITAKATDTVNSLAARLSGIPA
jgi:hypothetical protein